MILGYLKSFNPHLMGAWSSGTGGAGVGGSALYLLLYSVLHISNQTIFLLLLPPCLLYFVAWRYVFRTRVHKSITAQDEDEQDEAEAGDEEQMKHGEAGESRESRNAQSRSRSGSSVSTSYRSLNHTDVHPIRNVQSDEELPNPDDTESVSSPAGSKSLWMPVGEEAGRSEETSETSSTGQRTVNVYKQYPSPSSLFLAFLCVYVSFDICSCVAPLCDMIESLFQRTLRVSRLISSPALQLMAVYFLEYMISVGFASVANPVKKGEEHLHSWLTNNAYEVLAFCYQVSTMQERCAMLFHPLLQCGCALSISLLTMCRGSHGCVLMLVVVCSVSVSVFSCYCSSHIFIYSCLSSSFVSSFSGSSVFSSLVPASPLCTSHKSIGSHCYN